MLTVEGQRRAADLREHSGYLRSLFESLREFPFFALEPAIRTIGRQNRPTLIIWGDRVRLCFCACACVLVC
jgi:hypothetical protein